MGQEIFYCDRCRNQLRSADFEKGAAFQIDGQRYCKKCAREVVKSFPPEKLDPLVKKAEELGRQEKAPTSGASRGSQTDRIMKIASAPPSTRRRFREGSNPKPALMVLLGAGVLAVVLLALAVGGRSPSRPASQASGPKGDAAADLPPSELQIPRQRPEPARDPIPPAPPLEKREASAKEALRKATEFASANPNDLTGQRTRFEEAAWEARNTSLQEIARADLKAVEKRQLEAFSAELSALDEKTGPAVQTENFSAATHLLEEARSRHSVVEWTSAIDGKIAQVNEAAGKLYSILKDQALEARKRGRDAETKTIRDRVEKWGLASWSADFDRALAVAPPAPGGPPPETRTPAASPRPAPVPARPARLSLPDAARQREAESAVKKTFNVDQAKTSAEKSALARTLFKNAASSGAKDADLYVLLRMTRDLAVSASDPRTALDAVDAIAAVFDADAFSEKAALFARIQPRGAEAAAWARLCLDVSESAADASEYESAVKLAERAESLSRSANDKTFADAAKERSRDLAEARREADRVKPHLKTLETSPEDAAANGAAGRFYCLVKDDWPRGLVLSAKGSDASWKRLAEQDLANPGDPAARAALADAWAAQAEKEPASCKARLQGRASLWLERALPGLTGLARISAEKKLATLPPAPNPAILDLGGGVKLELVAIRPGTFTMGGTDGPEKAWHADHRPPHQVTITRGYFLGKYEVTRGQFSAFVKATRYKTDAEKEGKATGVRSDRTFGDIPGLHWQSPALGQTDDHPVSCVSWNDARAFCDWASGRTRRRVHLPTEAEWEYACRAGTTTRFHFGDDPGAMGEFAWLGSNSGLKSHPVGEKKPNAWGLFDMTGNAWEWCQDFAGPYSGDATDPEGPWEGEVRSLRGGGFGSDDCRSDMRGAIAPNSKWSHLGFRVAVR